MQKVFSAKFKNSYKTIPVFLILTLCLSFLSHQANAATISAIASGNWGSTSTWSSGLVPTSADDVTIDGNYTVTMNTTGAACNSLTLGSSTATATGSLTFGGYGLTVSGTVTFGGTYSSAATGTITMAAGSSLTCASFAVVNFGAFTPSTGTVVFTGTNSLPSNFTSFYNLTISSGTTTLGAATTVSGALVVNGTLAGSSSLTLSGASKTVDGAGTISAPLTFSASHSISSAATLSISSAITINTSVTVTNNGSITSTDNTTGIAGSSGSTWTNATGSSLTISGPFLTAASTSVTTSGTNTITYNGATQTVHASTSYNNLNITATGSTATAGGNITVGGLFDITAGTFNASTYTLTLNGTFNCAGTFTPTTTSAIVIGKSMTLPAAVTTVSSLTIGGASNTGLTLTLSANLIVSGSFASYNSTVSTTASAYSVTMSGGNTNLGLDSYLATFTGNGTFTLSANHYVRGGFTIAGPIVINAFWSAYDNLGSILTSTSSSGITGTGTLATVSSTSVIVAGAFLPSGTLSLNSGAILTVTYNGSTAQTLKNPSATTYPYNVIISNAVGVSVPSGGSTIPGNLTISSGAVLSCGANTLNMSSATSVVTNNGTVTSTATGGITGVSGTTWNNASGSALTLSGPFMTTSGTVLNTSGTNTITYNGSSQTIHSSSSYNNLTITAGATTHTLGGDITVGGLLNISSGTLSASSYTLSLGSGATFSCAGTFTPSTGTLSVSAGITLPSSISTYNNLTTSGTNTLTLGTNTTLNGALTIGSGTTLATGSNTIGIAGNLAVNGTLSGSGLITLSGSTTTIDGSGTVSNSAGLLISADHTVSSSASLSVSGPVSISGAYTVTNNGSFTSTSSSGIDGTAAGSTWANAGSNASLALSGPLMNTGTLTAAGTSNTITYNNTASGQTVNSITYNNLTIATTNQTATLGGNIIVNGTLTINSSSTLDVSTSNYTVAVNGTLTNNGTYNQRSNTTTFGGSSAQTIPSGTFNALTINNSNGVSLGGAVTVSGAVTLTSGSIDLGSNNFTAGSISGASASNYIKTSGSGSLIMNVASSPIMFPVGTSSYTPVTIDNSAGTPQNFDVNISDNALSSGTSGTTLSSHIVNKTWLIHNEGSSPNATITLQWNASDEASGFDRTSCYLSHYTNGAWDAGTVSAASGSDPYTLSRSGLTSFSPFGIGDGISQLPVSLITFKAIQTANAVQLNWTTASEQNNEGFEIEKSENAIDWNRIGFVGGAGNSNTVRNYDYTDNMPLSAAVIYYRLKQVDFNGKISYSSVQSVHRNAISTSSTATLWYGQEDNSLHINIPDNGEAVLANLKIIDMNGRIVRGQQLGASKNTVQTTQLSPGIYTIEIMTESGLYSRRFVKN